VVKLLVGEAVLSNTSHAAILRGPDFCLYRALPTKPAAARAHGNWYGLRNQCTGQPNRSGQCVQQLFLATSPWPKIGDCRGAALNGVALIEANNDFRSL
jgi:hypothetical protein